MNISELSENSTVRGRTLKEWFDPLQGISSKSRIACGCIRQKYCEKCIIRTLISHAKSDIVEATNRQAELERQLDVLLATAGGNVSKIQEEHEHENPPAIQATVRQIPTAQELFRRAHEAGHDSFGLCSDPELTETLDKVKEKKEFPF